MLIVARAIQPPEVLSVLTWTVTVIHQVETWFVEEQNKAIVTCRNKITYLSPVFTLNRCVRLVTGARSGTSWPTTKSSDQTPGSPPPPTMACPQRAHCPLIAGKQTHSSCPCFHPGDTFMFIRRVVSLQGKPTRDVVVDTREIIFSAFKKI